MNKRNGDDDYSEKETARRRDAGLLRALNTPPKPHSGMKLGKHRAKAPLQTNRRVNPKPNDGDV
jgi:hypothetical protein